MGRFGDTHAFYQLFTDLATGALEHVSDPVRCAEHVADQVRELLGVKAVAVFGCQGLTKPHTVLAVRPLRQLALTRRPEMDRLLHFSHGFRLAMTIRSEDASPAGSLLKSLELGTSILVPLRVGSEHIGALALLGLMDMHGIEAIMNGLNRLAPLLALIMRQADQFRDLELAVRERTAELRAARDRLEEQHGFLATLLGSLPNPVCVESVQGRLIRCNHAYEELFGPERDLIGTANSCRTPWDGFAPEDTPEGEAMRAEWECHLPDGVTRRMLSTRAPFRDHHGRVAGVINVLTDVTDLAEARAAAETSNRVKSEFLANMSHEIRTPLNGVLGMLQLLEQTSLDDEQQDLVHTAIRSSRRLTQLLSDILDLSRIEAGKLPLECTEFQFADLRDSVLDLFATTAANKGLALTFSIDDRIPNCVRGDEGRLRQILFNLVGNAIKFTAQGAIHVAAVFQNIGTDMAVRLSVTDTGVGIPHERHEDIFQTFTQVDGSAVRAFGGAGLGLAIVKRLVDMMRGKIEVESEPGQGTTMTVTIPIEPGRHSRHQRPEQIAPKAQGRRVLVVEDDQVNQLALLKMLQKLGHLPMLARDGREALDILGRASFDCVLMDIQMPIMDGVAATHAIRSASVPGAPPAIPIIALTGHAMSGDRERFLNAGMTDYLSKPVNLNSLAQAIDRAVR